MLDYQKTDKKTFCMQVILKTIYLINIRSTNICFLHMFTEGRGTHHTHPYPHRHRVPTPIWVKHFLNSCAFKSTHWRIQEFHNQGHGPGAVEFLGSGDCFDAPSHIPNVFVVRVVNKIHIVNIACWLQSKYMRVICSQNLQDTSLVCRSWIRLCEIRNYFFLFPIFYAWFMACEGYI